VSSIKNFQLMRYGPSHSTEVVLQFGKASEQTFILDYAGPWTPMQAFGVALCQFVS
jgi:hypothetical protein